jgi:hypothetical protein
MFKIGCDPELFLMKDGKFVSVEDNRGPLIPGTKKKPFAVKGGAIQVDGVAAEFNIDAADNFEQFFGNIKSVVGELRNRIRKIDASYQLTATPTATFDRRYFDNLPKHTLELGCEPDYNAHTDGKPNPRPQTSEPFRTGSGHIHIGWCDKAEPFSQGHMLDCILVAKALDETLYKASTGWDNDKKRQQLYGQPGSFRPKSYGMEYRPLSNVWVKSPKTIKYVYDIAIGVMKEIDSGTYSAKDIKLYSEETIQDAVWSYYGDSK